MPGLVPGIHDLRARRISKVVDGRDKPGHNEVVFPPALIIRG
jgi:hypothetical protein